jgi:hypothetical protein
MLRKLNTGAVILPEAKYNINIFALKIAKLLLALGLAFLSQLASGNLTAPELLGKHAGPSQRHTLGARDMQGHLRSTHGALGTCRVISEAYTGR